MDVYSYHNVEALAGTLNAIAAVCGAQDYRASIAVVVFFGFFSAAMAYAFAPQKMQGWQWLASVVLVFSVLFVPKDTVRVLDVTDDSPPKVVANVPLGLSLMAGATSQVGHVLTGLIETAFSNIPGDSPVTRPADLSFQRNGLMFGARMVDMSQNVVFRTPTFRADMGEYLSNCVEPELINGTIPVDKFMTSTKLWEELGSYANPARFTRLSGRDDELATCKEAYADLSERMKTEKDSLLKFLAFQAHPASSDADLVSRVESEITASYAASKLGAASAAAGDSLIQAAMVNAINEGADQSFASSGDMMSLLIAQANASTLRQKNTAFVANAKLAEQALPVVRNVIEAVTYALFPFVVLLLFLSGGRDTVVGLKNYASILIWIQLWPPLYAILNFMASVYASYDIAAAAMIDPAASESRGIALATYGAINDSALSCQAVVGYLTAAIPFLAWSALKRMENFGTAMAGGWQSVQQTGDAAASSASLGNMTWSSVSRTQQNLGPNVSNAAVSRTQDERAAWITSDAYGHKTIQVPMNSGPVSGRTTISARQERERVLSNAQSAARSQRNQATASATAALANAYDKLRSMTNTDTGSEGTGNSYSRTGIEGFNEVSNASGGFLKRIGLDDTAENREAAGLLAVGNGVAYSGNQRVADAIEKVKNAMKQKDHSNGENWSKGYLEEMRHSIITAAVNSSKAGKTSTLTESLSRVKTADAVYQETTAQLEAAKASTAADTTFIIETGMVTGDTAEVMQDWRGEGFSRLVAHAFGRTGDINDLINQGNWLAGANSPHLTPPGVVTRQDGTVIGSGDDLKKQAEKDAAALPTQTLSEAELKPIKDQKEKHDAVVAREQGSADANNVGTVRQAKPDAGPGHVGKRGDYINSKAVDAQDPSHAAPANLSPFAKRIMGEVGQQSKEIKDFFDHRADRDINYIWNVYNKDGEIAVDSAGLNLVGEQFVRRTKAAGKLGDYVYNQAQELQMQAGLAVQHGGLGSKSWDAAGAELQQLKAAAKNGDYDAAEKLSSLLPSWKPIDEYLAAVNLASEHGPVTDQSLLNARAELKELRRAAAHGDGPAAKKLASVKSAIEGDGSKQGSGSSWNWERMRSQVSNAVSGVVPQVKNSLDATTTSLFGDTVDALTTTSAEQQDGRVVAGSRSDPTPTNPAPASKSDVTPSQGTQPGHSR